MPPSEDNEPREGDRESPSTSSTTNAPPAEPPIIQQTDAEATGDPPSAVAVDPRFAIIAADRLRRRARLLKAVSYVTLLLIGGVLSGGIYLFVFADELSVRLLREKESAAYDEILAVLERIKPHTDKVGGLVIELDGTLSENKDRIAGIVSNVERYIDEFHLVTRASEQTVEELGELFRRQREFFQRSFDAAPSEAQEEKAEGEAANVGEGIGELPELDNDFRATTKDILDNADEVVSTFNRETLPRVNRTIEYLGETISWIGGMITATTELIKESSLAVDSVRGTSDSITDYAKFKLDEARSAKEDLSTNQLVSALSTRIGAVLILVFLVQILVSLYRYNVRMAAFFDSRADALELSAEAKELNLASLVSILSPDSIDFGRAPRSPTADVAALVKALVAREKGS